MADLFTEPVRIFLEKGLEALERSSKFGDLKRSVAERVRREAAFDREIFQATATAGADGARVRALLATLEDGEFRAACSSPIPLARLLPRRLDRNAWPERFRSGRFAARTAADRSQADLAERAFRRVKLMRNPALAEGANFDYAYARDLMAALERELGRPR
ncbi:MAG: hypothetical protein JXA15_01505 [Spirochaetales bacterium]|nr:hypothetical protein [Spirochaetales bacterium]